MSKPIISLIWAMDRNRLIGKDNGMPWRIPAEMAYFRRTTMGHSVIMGRKTFESFGSKPLPGRKNIIMTRDQSYEAPGCIVVHSIEEAISSESETGEIFVIGGSEIYKQFLSYANQLYVTKIDETFEGDAYFPELDMKEWVESSSEQGLKDEKNPYTYYFKLYKRREENRGLKPQQQQRPQNYQQQQQQQQQQREQ